MKKLLFLVFFVVMALVVLVNAQIYAVQTVQAQLASNELFVVMTEYKPFPAEAGKYVNVWIKVQNTGAYRANDVKIEFVDKYPFSLDPGEIRNKTFLTLDPGKSVLVEYRVRVASDAIEGRNPLRIRISADGNIFFEQNFDIYVESKTVDFAIGSVLSQPEKLFGDTEGNKITVSLQNTGKATAKLVKVDVRFPDGFTPTESYSNTYSIGDVAAETSKDAIFYVDIDKSVKAGTYVGIMKISYKDDNDGEYKTRTLDLNLPVRARPSFEIIDVEFKPNKIGQGMAGVQMTLTILNAGGAKAENVNARVLLEATQPFDFSEKSNFVGTLEKNESGQAVFHFDVDRTADMKKYMLDIEIRYTQDSTVNIANDKISLEVSVPLPNYTGLYIFIIILAAIAGGMFWYYKK